MLQPEQVRAIKSVLVGNDKFVWYILSPYHPVSVMRPHPLSRWCVEARSTCSLGVNQAHAHTVYTRGLSSSPLHLGTRLGWAKLGMASILLHCDQWPMCSRQVNSLGDELQLRSKVSPVVQFSNPAQWSSPLFTVNGFVGVIEAVWF